MTLSPDVYLREAAQWRSLLTGDTKPAAGGPSPMYVGAWNLPGGESNWLALEAQTGHMGIRRTYTGGMPSTAPAVVQQDYGKRASWHSVKANWTATAAGQHDAAIISFCQSIPEGHQMLLTIDHEPENDNPLSEEAARSAEWRAANEHYYDVVKSVRPDFLVGPILMGWTFNPASGRSVVNWTISGDKCDFYGIDEYNPHHFPMIGSPTQWVNQPSPTMTAFTQLCNSLGVPGAVGETATSEDMSGVGPARKVAWMNDLIGYAEANNYLAVCYFNAYKPGDTSEAMMIESSPQSIAAWADIVAAHPRGIQ